MAQRKPKTPSSPTLKAEKKRTEILKAAGKCFRKTGFHQTSMQEICTETGLGPGAVYRYFVGKDAIIEAMAEDERCQARALLGETSAADLPDALTAVTQAFAERYAAAGDAGLMMEIYAEGLRNKRVGSVVKKTEAQWVNELAGLLRGAQARGQMDAALDASHTALFLTALWDGMAIRQAYDTEHKPAAFAAIFDAMLKRVLRDSKPDKHGKTPVAATAAPIPSRSDDGERRDIDKRQLSLI